MRKRDLAKTGLGIVGTIGTSSLLGAGVALATAVSPCGGVIFGARMISAVLLAGRVSKIAREEAYELIDDICELTDEVTTVYESKGI